MTKALLLATAFVFFCSPAWAVPILNPTDTAVFHPGQNYVLLWEKSVLPPQEILQGSRVNINNGPKIFTLNVTGDYIVVHWGGKHGGEFQLFNLTGIKGPFQIMSPPGFGGISWYEVFDDKPPSVPEPSTLLLLGGGLAGLAGLRTIFRKN